MTDRQLEPDEPEQPTEVSEPTEVVEPGEPEEPTEVVEPGEPEEPTEVVEPEEPTEVVEPGEPEEPTEVVEPEEPTEVVEPGEPEEPTEVVEPEEPATEEKAAPEEPEDTTEVVPPHVRVEPLLRRSRDDRVIAGVCGGLGRYFGIDPVLVRIAALLLIFAGGAGIVLYLIGWLAIPDESDGPERRPAEDELERRRGAALFGLVFIALGIFFLLDEVWPDLSWRYIWPAALIAVGLAIVLGGRR